MFCTKCGNEVTEESVFCSKCGNRLKKDNDVNMNSKKNELNKTNIQNVNYSYTKPFKKTNRTGLYVGLTIILLIVCVTFFATTNPNLKQIIAEKNKEDTVNQINSYAVQAAKEIIMENSTTSPDNIDWISTELIDKDEYGRYMVDAVWDSKNAFGVEIRSYILVVLQSMDSLGNYTYSPLFVINDYEVQAMKDFGIEMAKSLNQWGLAPDSKTNTDLASANENSQNSNTSTETKYPKAINNADNFESTMNSPETEQQEVNNDTTLIKDEKFADAYKIAQSGYPEFTNWSEGSYGENTLGEPCIGFTAHSEELQEDYYVMVNEDGSCYARTIVY